MGGMDRYCSMIIVVGVVVLIFMGFNEFTRMTSHRDRTINTCGMRTHIASTKPKIENDDSSVSARRSANRTQNDASKMLSGTQGDYLGLNQDWAYMLADSPDEGYKGQPQDQEALADDFDWAADEQVSKQFDNNKVDAKKIMYSMNNRSNMNSQAPEVLYSRQLGMKNYIWDKINNTYGDDSQRSFKKKCAPVPWGSSESYISARKIDGASISDDYYDQCDSK